MRASFLIIYSVWSVAESVGAFNLLPPAVAFLPPCDKPTQRRSRLATRLYAKEVHSSSHSKEIQQPSRRELVQWGARALSTAWILGNRLAVAAAPESVTASSPKKIIVLTGGNSGIGYQAALQLAQQGHTLLLPCRTLDKSMDTVERLTSQLSPSSAATLIPAECNLASLASIQSFSERIPNLLASRSTSSSGQSPLLDVVCLNAGLARNANAKDILRTADGFELTVGTNHFGHFYLNHLLLPMIQPAGGRIVVTASGVHDPESPGGAQGAPATLGDLQGLQRDGRNFAMVDGSDFNADKAYKDSKLCNVLFTRELQSRLEGASTTKGITANCFNPGLIVGTGLFRDQNPLFTKVFDLAATDLFKVGEVPEWGGGALAYMTSVNTQGCYYSSPPGSSKYGDVAFGNQFQASGVSKEAQDDEKAKKLWELSEKLLRISS